MRHLFRRPRTRPGLAGWTDLLIVLLSRRVAGSLPVRVKEEVLRDAWLHAGRKGSVSTPTALYLAYKETI
jgi:hypothetical protein